MSVASKAAVKRWLESHGWTVYEHLKVQQRASGSMRSPALVMTRGEEIGVVEIATTLGLEVMSSADGWRRYANRVLVVVPRSARRSKLSLWAQQWGHDKLFGSGIGVLHVRSTTTRERREGEASHVAGIRVTWGMHDGADVTGLRAALAERLRHEGRVST